MLNDSFLFERLMKYDSSKQKTKVAKGKIIKSVVLGVRSFNPKE